MSRILSLLLILSILLPTLLILTACKDGGDEGTNPPATPPAKEEEKAPALYLPTAGSFEGHSKENFSTFVYSAPNVENLISALSVATERIESEETTYEAALSAVSAAEKLYASFTSMLSYAQISYSKNASDTYFSGEYKRLYSAIPKVSLALEKLFSAVSASKHGAALAETEYFASDIVSRYQNGGIYTEETLPLFERETALLLEADAISPDTVTVTILGKTDTVTNLLNTFAGVYGTNSAEYQQIQMISNTAYNKAANKKNAEIYLSLLSVRREIADTLGYDSFAQISMHRTGYGFGEKEASDMLSTVENYLLPVYQALSSTDYFSSNTGKVKKIKFPEAMLNTLTRFYEAKGGKLFEGYNYLLHHSLFSIAGTDATRAKGAYASFFFDRAQPYFYMSTEGSAKDYLTAAEALGSAVYSYHANARGDAFAALMRTPELTDAYGFSLRLLTLQGMKEALSDAESTMEDSSYLVLLKAEMYNILQITLTQCMRTQIELEAYALKGDEISEAALNEIVIRAAKRFDCFELQDGAPIAVSLSTEGLLNRDMLAKPTMVLSDLTSAYVAINLFIAEAQTEGAGFTSLQTLLSADESLSYAKVLEALSIPLPTSAEDVHALSATLYELLTGYAYNITPLPTLTYKAA